jgi:hypothetical protein
LFVVVVVVGAERVVPLANRESFRTIRGEAIRDFDRMDD